MKANKKIIAIAASAAIAGCMALAGCASQPASSFNASNSNSSPAASTTANTNSAPAANTNTAPASNTAASNTAPVSNTAPAQGNYMPQENAIDIALADAGFGKDAVTDLECKLDVNESPVHYDVEFKANGQEYDYDVDASTGQILEHKNHPDD